MHTFPVISLSSTSAYTHANRDREDPHRHRDGENTHILIHTLNHPITDSYKWSMTYHRELCANFQGCLDRGGQRAAHNHSRCSSHQQENGVSTNKFFCCFGNSRRTMEMLCGFMVPLHACRHRIIQRRQLCSETHMNWLTLIFSFSNHSIPFPLPLTFVLPRSSLPHCFQVKFKPF